MGCGSSKKLADLPSEEKKDGTYFRSMHIFTSIPIFSSGCKKTIEIEEFEKEKYNGSSKSVTRLKTKFDPRVVAKYDVKALIGRGSFGKVVRAERRGSKQPFAIKMFNVKDKQAREACDSEWNVLIRVRNDYIVRLWERFETSDTYYMVMELATGGKLFDRIISLGSFSERDAVKIFQMILRGVDHLHRLGITHRDLKPENLLYLHPGQDSKILITDFGLASTRSSGEEVTMTAICGTPEYLAPEIYMRKPYTCAVDNWALGVIAFIMLSGMMPFDDENKAQLYRKIVDVYYSFDGDPWPQVSQAAKDFIRAFLTDVPTQRMTAYSALSHPWIVNHSFQSSTNLHRSISQNLLKRVSSRHSYNSSESGLSNRSVRSQHRKVKTRELNDLLTKYQSSPGKPCSK